MYRNASYNNPGSITQGIRTISFQDGTEHQGFKQVIRCIRSVAEL